MSNTIAIFNPILLQSIAQAHAMRIAFNETPGLASQDGCYGAAADLVETCLLALGLTQDLADAMYDQLMDYSDLTEADVAQRVTDLLVREAQWVRRWTGEDA